MTNLGQLCLEFERLWPTSGAEDWDTPGIQIGKHTDKVSRVLLTVDVTSQVVEEAIDGGFDLILAHHPMFLRGVTHLDGDSSKGSLVSVLNRAEISVYAAHTNADIVQNGVSSALANQLELVESTAISPSGAEIGHGRIGRLAEPLELLTLARMLANLLPPTASGVRVAGNPKQKISVVALCGGAGDSFLADAYRLDADVYITSDLRHHPTLEAIETAHAQEKDFSIIDISHWAAEWLWLDIAATQLSEAFPQLQFVVSELRTDPWDFAVTQ